MNTHKALGLLAAVLVTAGQALVFAADTSATSGDEYTRGGYETTLDDSVASAASVAGQAVDQRSAG
jgi:hypothetical protein